MKHRLRAFTTLLPKIAAASVLLGITTGAHSGLIYEYSIDNPNGSAAGGDLRNITTRFDATRQIFSWEYTVENKNDSFWLVVNGGPEPGDGTNPKGLSDLAILYGDLDPFSPNRPFGYANNRLWAYDYDGTNSSGSWTDPTPNRPNRLAVPLAVWDDQITVVDAGGGYQTISFSIDVSHINIDPNDPKIGFADQIGIWFHPATGSSFDVVRNANNRRYPGIKSYTYARNGYHDSAYQDANRVPEPGALALLGIGGIALGLARRRRVVKG